MVTDPLRSPWSVLTASSVGSSHRATDAPNQDAVATFETDSGLVVAIADGHGGRRYVRSATGAGLAVSVAQRLGVGVLAQARPLMESVSALPGPIVAQWRSAVAEDLARSPLGPDQLAVVGDDAVVAYGATLLVLVFRGAEAVGLQLGDGDIVTAWRHGVVECPLPPDPRNVGGQTMSLCLPDALTSFRVASLTGANGPPHLVIAATDGYGNSFADPNWPQHAATDLLDQQQRLGDAAIAAALPHWVSESASVGGDDTTVALVFGSASRAPVPPPPPVGSTDATLVLPATEPRAQKAASPVPPPAPPAMPTRPPRSTAAPRSRLALGSIAAATLLLVGAGAFAAGRSTARDSAATTDPVSASGDDTSATFSTFSSVVGVTVASLEPTTTSARVAPTTVVATTTTVTLPPSTTSPSTTSPAQTPIGLDDPRVRVVADALSVDVDAWSRPPTATYGPSAIPSPAITAVASIGGAWAIDDAGDLTVQRTTAREPEVVVRADDARGRPVALATGAGVVIAVLTREADGEILVVSVLVFDGRAVAVMRPMAITATPADDAGGTSTAGPAVTGDDVPAATVVGGTDDSSSSTTEAER